MTRVNVSSNIIDWALRRSGRSVMLQEKFPNLDAWKTGSIQPTVKQLEEFARSCSTPLGYLFLETPPDDLLPIPHFRTIKDKQVSQPSANLLATVHTMERRQEWMRQYLISQDADEIMFVGSGRQEIDIKRVDIKKAARDFRRALNLEDHWASKQANWTAALAELRQKIESLGILVIVNGIVGNNTHRKLDPAEFRGFVLIDKFAPLIFVNGADCKAAQMFTLAHEIAHVWLGTSAAFDLQQLEPSADNIEKFCNQLAAEFLVPENELKAIWHIVGKESDNIEQLSKHFKVSQLVAARRVSDLGLVSKSWFYDFYKHYLEQEHVATNKIEKPSGDFYKTQNLRLSRRFAETVITATREGSLLFNEAYRLTGLHGKTFDSYAKTIQVGE